MAQVFFAGCVLEFVFCGWWLELDAFCSLIAIYTFLLGHSNAKLQILTLVLTVRFRCVAFLTPQ
jgi:hypothetical protein